jgi:hypothetical protein
MIFINKKKMGKIILRNNGLETQVVNGVDFTSLTPENGVYYIGVDLVTGDFQKLNPNGDIIDIEVGTGGDFTGGTVNGETTFTNGLITNSISATTYLNLPIGGGLIEKTYSELVDLINGGTLERGSFYLITDYRTCYDQPDFDYDGNPITNGNYKEGPIEPILVLAIDVDKISSSAYQPLYPNDKITYDWTFNETETTNGVAFGRITERIDEFNNRTDYDHRNILFKRYRLFTHREELRLNGTVELLNDGTVNGTNTSFTNLSVGDVVYISAGFPNIFEIVSIDDDVTMTVSGDTINNTGSGAVMYRTVEETNDSNGYFSYKKTNVKSNDYQEYTTFGDAISSEYAINNYVGNYVNYYQNIDSGTFILANNVFLEGGYQSNKFGDYCYNNTFGTDNSNNIWGDWCAENVSTNDIDDNIIGHEFRGNLINVNLTNNHIGNDFRDNRLLSENGDDFEDNLIGNGFRNNIVYSRFYKNHLLDNFRDNVIGDYGNLDNLEFYRNYIKNNFNNNIIKRIFQNNQISTNFQSNEINGDFVGNTILNGFNNNNIGNYFWSNEIGNGFNNNNIFDDFFGNKTDYYFNGNIISNQFYTNIIGSYFNGNRPSNTDLFGWSDLSTVSTRTYDTFLNSVGGQLGRRIMGKEFVMRVISTSQYFKIKFIQWTEGGNGGGLQYERQEIDSNGNNIGSFVIFTKTNYGNEVDIVVPGVVEITRGNQNGIYNVVTEGSWNGSVSPDDTEWNSIYTEPNNGERFAYNTIGNNFFRNIIGSDFGYGFSQAQGNVIYDNFESNVIGQFMYNNVIGNYFTNNTIGDNFENNSIKNYFISNTILDNFESNEIGDYFGNNGSGSGSPIQNIIFNDFKYNKIGNFFGNDTNFPTVGGGSNGDGGNIINDGFQFNVIGDNFIYNAIDLSFTNNKIGNDFWFNFFGQSTSDNTIGNLFVGNSGIGGFPNAIGDNFISNNLGNYSAFNEIDSDFQYNKIGHFFGNAGSGTQNIIYSECKNNQIGNYFGNDESQTDGGNTIYSYFYDNLIGNRFYGNYIGDNSRNYNFYRNDIGNDFRNNIVYQEFQNNEIGNQFNNNINGNYFIKNIIGNGFNGNVVSYFDSNKVGNGANNNIINYDFYNNVIGDYFAINRITDGYNNSIGYSFRRNIFGTGFGFNEYSDILTRTYDTFRNSLNGNIGNFIIGRELILQDTVNNEYYSVVFTKWTQGGNGGGFKYTRQLIFPSFGSVFTFERPDNDDSVIDVIVPGVLEIKRDSNGGGIYNSATEVSFNSSVSPSGTTWNSNFTSPTNGNNFIYNSIGDDFQVNSIESNFQLNDVKPPISSTDFSGATHVYGGYNCTIFNRQDGTPRLSYYDNSDVLNITDIDA